MKHAFVLSLLYFASISSLFSQVEHLKWSHTIGGSQEDRCSAIAVDAEENVYSTGWFQATVDFDPSENSFSLISLGESDIYVRKNGPDGSHLWTRSFGGSGLDHGRSIQVDGDGNVYVTGMFRGTVDFDPSTDIWNLTSQGDEDIFVLKLDPYGNFLWAQSMGGSRRDGGMAMEIASSGHIYVAGYFSDSMQYATASGTQTLLSNNFEDGFLLKLDPSGHAIWAHALGGPESNDWAQDLAIDADDNVYVTGFFGRSADFDPSPDSLVLTADDFTDIFIAKFQSDGQIDWARSLGGPALEFGVSIDSDPFGNSYVTGYYNSSLYCDSIFVHDSTQALASAGAWDIFLTKLNPQGYFQWIKSIGDATTEQGFSIAVSSSNELYLSGAFYGLTDLDPSTATAPIQSDGHSDMYLSKLDTAGQLLWVESLGGTGEDAGTALFMDAKDNLYVAGHFSDTAVFDYSFAGPEFISQGDKDMFFLKVGTCAPPSVNVSQSSFTLSVEEVEAASYQWVNCSNDFMPIEGETAANFTAKENGQYACIVSTGACSDTSTCFAITTVGLPDRIDQLEAHIYPNPTGGKLFLDLKKEYQDISITIIDIQGRKIFHEEVQHQQAVPLHVEAAPGIYFLHLIADEKRTMIQLLKE